MRDAYCDPGGCRSIASLLHIDDDRWLLSSITTAAPERGNGAGSRVLDVVCHAADAADAVLVLVVSPDPDDAGLPVDALVTWYGRRGFVLRYDRDHGCPIMEREPR